MGPPWEAFGFEKLALAFPSFLVTLDAQIYNISVWWCRVFLLFAFRFFQTELLLQKCCRGNQAAEIFQPKIHMLA